MIINDSEIPYDQAVKGTFIVLLIEFDIEETLDRGPLKARISNRWIGLASFLLIIRLAQPLSQAIQDIMHSRWCNALCTLFIAMGDS